MTHKTPHLLIAGAGIGGLAAALALARIGVKVTVLEQADIFSEVGVGVQMSPNAFGILTDWGLSEALRKVANFPEAMHARDAATDKLLGDLELGHTALRNYGFEYATIHRADLHRVLLEAVVEQAHVHLHLNAKIADVSEMHKTVTVTTEQGEMYTADALIGCDGLWSQVRRHVLSETALTMRPLATGYIAWRALLPIDKVPMELHKEVVTAWLAPKMHAVTYPVRRSQFLNLVVVTEDDMPNNNPIPQSWSRDSKGLSPLQLIGKSLQLPSGKSGVLLNLLQAVTQTGGGDWTRWTLFDRDPMSSSLEMVNPAHPLIALLGDAAHPMRPFLAQGAAMALEDAKALGESIQEYMDDLPDALEQYAQNRWQRNARVQARSRRSGEIFHLAGPMRWARNATMAMLGRQVMDIPWLYEGM